MGAVRSTGDGRDDGAHEPTSYGNAQPGRAVRPGDSPHERPGGMRGRDAAVAAASGQR
ncbi:hypothetical protein EMIT0158MI4_170012 [Burkholderia ambifaria]